VWGINLVYQACAFLPMIGLLAGLLPDVKTHGSAEPHPEASTPSAAADAAA
jgi:hypothetical protein